MPGLNPFMHSAKQDVVSTPQCILDDLNAVFHFDFDPAPINPTFDGLAPETRWGKSNYINPPFSDIEPWMRKAVACGELCVFLVPLRTNSDYWRDHVWPNIDGIYFFTGGIQFGGYKKALATPIGIVVFNYGGPLPKLTKIGGIGVQLMTPPDEPPRKRPRDDSPSEALVASVSEARAVLEHARAEIGRCTVALNNLVDDAGDDGGDSPLVKRRVLE